MSYSPPVTSTYEASAPAVTYGASSQAVAPQQVTTYQEQLSQPAVTYAAPPAQYAAPVQQYEQAQVTYAQSPPAQMSYSPPVTSTYEASAPAVTYGASSQAVAPQ